MDGGIGQAIAQGALQGVTEFLPVSSSGHLTLYRLIFGESALSPSAAVSFGILLHVGTLLALIAVYRVEIWGIIAHPLKSDLKYLALATVPAVAAALLWGGEVESLFEGGLLGISFLINSAVLLFAEAITRFMRNRRDEVGWLHASAMGVMQAVAILPGLSRSGSSIAGGLAAGLKRKRAADFAFLMAIPAVLGSMCMEIIGFAKDNAEGSASFAARFGEAIDGVGGWRPALAGFAAAAVVGFLSIRFMLAFIRKMSLNWFALYTGLLGGILILWQFTKSL